ncbi:hydrolase [Streptomyces sulfonofaciens]|uniref:Hydrolase n=1 Tax=Streptomyces sulfonofaciens TaxID=68272 RepID=A0A919KV14_9ACTN|nr:HAD-IA family hydrolase [Streptomyces sulfonofaciens]GHH72686.1 hydrolase [Streptomyces sulfonofaciens]
MTAIRAPLAGVPAVVLDTDGVIVDSARVHAAAWQRAFDAYLAAHPPDDPAQRRPFDPHEDYLSHVDGKARLDGAAAFLASRGLHPSQDEVDDVAARKDEIFVARLREGGIGAYPGTVRLLAALRADGVRLAAASASRHARDLLVHAGADGLFDALVDGVVAARLRLPGKPDPALFLEAARRLGRPPEATALVEDAVAGVEAGRRGRFHPVVGVHRTQDPGAAERLRCHGADLVVRDLGELLTEGAST